MADETPAPAPTEVPQPAPEQKTETAAEVLGGMVEKEAQVPAVADAFEAMDRLDEEQVVAEMTGRRSQIAEALVYVFKQQGKLVAGLSKRGVDEAVRYMARRFQPIRELKLLARRVEGGIEAKCLSGRYLVPSPGQEQLLETRWGVKFQPTFETVSWGGGQRERPDRFAYEKACMKAARNASRRLIPEEIVTSVIEAVLALQPDQAKVVTARGVAAKQIDVAVEEAKHDPLASKIDEKTVQRIQIGFKECDIAEGERRGVTHRLFGVESVNDLTPEQGVRCLEHLRTMYKAKQSRGGPA